MDFTKPFNVTKEVWWDGPFYTEGPLVDRYGNRYFTTLTGGRILRAESTGEPVVWASSMCPNGQAMLPCGDVLVCDSREAALKRFDSAGRFLKDELKGHCAGERVQVPNDVVVDSDGGFYFTDSVRDDGKVFYKGADGSEHLLASGLDFPNGLVWAPQSRTLFVAESYRNRMLALSQRQKKVTDAYRIFATLPKHGSGLSEANLPDGVALDVWGNLWIAHYGMGALRVLDGQGKLVATIPTGIPLTSNLCFLCFAPLTIMVTGGFGEPGPGQVILITIEQSMSS